MTLAEVPRPLLLALFSLGCAPCWEVLPILEGLSQEVAVGLVAVDGSAGLSEVDRERLGQFLNEAEKLGGKARVLLDQDFRMVEAYRVGQSPTFMLIDGKGVIAGVWQGEVETEKLVEEVAAALAEDH
jgi:thiol-disulfide isomerase/thioredoxin